jgi:hypothetical protein
MYLDFGDKLSPGFEAEGRLAAVMEDTVSGETVCELGYRTWKAQPIIEDRLDSSYQCCSIAVGCRPRADVTYCQYEDL